MKKSIFLSIVGLFIVSYVYSQHNDHNQNQINFKKHNGVIRCGTIEIDSMKRANNPKMDPMPSYLDWVQNKVEKHKQKYLNGQTRATVLYIPVVVHVIHNGDAIGSGENIADGQVLSQIEVLNEDFRKLMGSNGYNTHPDGADIEVEFCMAQVDPNGNATDGIDRVNAGQSSWDQSNIESTLKPNTIWDPTQYCNMWTVRFGGGSSGLLGYAQFPDNSGLAGMPTNGGAANTDGVVMAYSAFGSSDKYPSGTYNAPYDLGRTTTHEVGHWLGLRHIWGDGGCSVDDFCSDTPTSDAANYGCPSEISCSSTDMVENYMDYTNDACMNIFTLDQKDRIRAVLNNSPRRQELPFSNACNPPVSVDAGISAIVSPNGDYCNTNSFIPTVTLNNYGSTDLNSVDIIYNVDNGANQTFSWTGTLVSGNSVDIDLPSVTIADGSHSFNAWTDNPNNTADGNNTNDTASVNFTNITGTATTLSLSTDCWGQETYWELLDGSSTVIYSGGNTTGIPPGGQQISNNSDPGAYDDQVTITENWCLADGCYDFVIYDDFGDGLNGTAEGCAVDGTYSLTEDATSTVLATIQNIDFGNSETQNFCVTNGCISDAGSMDTNPIEICSSNSATATHNGDQTTDTDDVMEFILHTNSGTNLGTIISTNSTPTFSFGGGMTYGTTYYISAIVGNDDGGGNVDQSDPCFSVASGTPVTWYANPTVDAGADQTVCDGAAVTLSASGANSYAWNNGVSDGVAFNPTSTNTYTVTGTDGNGCQGTDQVTVTVNTNPTVDAGTDQTICDGAAITLSGSGANSYTWNNGVSDGVAFNPTTTNTYTVTGTDGNGCQGTDQVTVTVNPSPTVNAGADQTVCEGTSVTLSGSGANSYTWNNGATDGVAFNPTSTNTYTVTGTDGNGCQGTDQVTVTVNANPTVDAGADQTVCEGTSVTLSASGANSYTWNNGVTDGVAFTPTTTNTYTVTGTDGNGCQGTDQVTVTVNANPTVDAGVDQTVCDGAAVTLSASGANSYTWNNGVSDGVAFNPTTTNTYTVTGTDGNGCQGTDQVTVTIIPNPTISGVVTHDNGSANGAIDLTVNAGSSTTFDWSNGATTEDITNLSAGDYIVTVTDTNECTAVDTFTVLSTVNLIDLENALTIYPNPTNGLITIEIKGEFQIKLFDSRGRLILSDNATNQEKIDLSPFESGIYHIRIKQNNSVLNRKIILK